MSVSTTYLLNVSLHAAVLSAFASLVLLALRQARHRSVTAIAGLLAVGFLPWLTALRPAQPVIAPAAEIQTQESHALPTWTVVTLPASQKTTPPTETPAAAPTKFEIPDPLAAAITIWAAGAGIGALLLSIAWLKVSHWQKTLQPLDDTAWQTLQSLTPEIPARHRFRLSETSASPCVTGFFRPRIILPRFLFVAGSEAGLRWALRHETAHWQAGDSRWMILFTLIRCANWWNPLVHRLITQWSDAREQLCDLQATGISETRADYGKFLIAMARKIDRQPPLTVAMAKRPHALRLKRRVISLLEASARSEKPVGRSFIALSSAVFVACAVVVSSVRIGAEEPARQQPVAETKAVPSAPAPDSIKPSEDSKTPAAPEEACKQVKTTARLVMTKTKPVLKDGAILNDGEILPYLKSISTTKGSTLMTSPSVTNRFGESATIEIVREVPGNAKQIAGRGPNAPVPIVGIVFESYADLVGDQAQLKFEAAYHFIPGAYEPILDSNGEFPKGLDPDKIKSIEHAVTAMLGSGQTVCVDLGEIEPGKFLQIFTRVEAIDATGRTLDGFRNGKPLPIEEPKNQPTTKTDLESQRQMQEEQKRRAEEGTLPLSTIRGVLRLSGTLVDLPLKGERPPGEGLVIGLTPTTRKTADKILSTPGAKIRKLEPVEIPLDERRTPWSEFPGLSVTGIASRDFKLLTISSHAVGDGGDEFPNTWEDIATGSMMNFGIKTADTAIERRLLFKVEAIRFPRRQDLPLHELQKDIQKLRPDSFRFPLDPPVKNGMKKS